MRKMEIQISDDKNWTINQLSQICVWLMISDACKDPTKKTTSMPKRLHTTSD